MLSKYKTIHILLTYVHLDCRGEGTSNRNASRDESVETGDESVETRDESIEAGEKHNNHVIISIITVTVRDIYHYYTEDVIAPDLSNDWIAICLWATSWTNTDSLSMGTVINRLSTVPFSVMTGHRIRKSLDKLI